MLLYFVPGTLEMSEIEFGSVHQVPKFLLANVKPGCIVVIRVLEESRGVDSLHIYAETLALIGVESRCDTYIGCKDIGIRGAAVGSIVKQDPTRLTWPPPSVNSNGNSGDLLPSLKCTLSDHSMSLSFTEAFGVRQSKGCNLPVNSPLNVTITVTHSQVELAYEGCGSIVAPHVAYSTQDMEYLFRLTSSLGVSDPTSHSLMFLDSVSVLSLWSPTWSLPKAVDTFSWFEPETGYAPPQYDGVVQLNSSPSVGGWLSAKEGNWMVASFPPQPGLTALVFGGRNEFVVSRDCGAVSCHHPSTCRDLRGALQSVYDLSAYPHQTVRVAFKFGVNHPFPHSQIIY